MKTRYFHYSGNVAIGIGALALALGCGESESGTDDNSSPQGGGGGSTSPTNGAGSNAGPTSTVRAPSAGENEPIINVPETPGSTPAGPGESCIELDVQAERVVPTLLLLLDQSGSMAEQFGDSTRWDTLRDILVDPTDGVIPRFEQDIEFGIATYTSLDGNTSGEECPMVNTLPIGPSASQSAADFLGSSDDLVRDSDTPTAESIQAATAILEQTNNGGPRAIILATDGEPDDCDEPDNHGPAQKQASVDAVSTALARNIETYVISVGDDVAAEHLQDLANAGIGVDSGAPYYEALNATALADAFNEIIFGVTPCEFELNGTVAAADRGLGTVVVGGVAATFQDPNGWDMPAESTVTLSGDACEAAKNGALVEIDFPCNTFVPNAK